jgi:hypothetical protein
MEPTKRKFVFTKALYVMLWVFVVYWALVIILCSIDGLRWEDWHPIGLLYEGCIWDYLMFTTSLLLALSFKKEKKTLS